MKRALLSLGLVFGASLAATEAFAWRETGHWAVCEIAYRHASGRTKAALDDIMGGEYARQCTWPDMVRNSKEIHPALGGPLNSSYDWHFINLDDGQDYWKKENLSPKGDVLRAILKSLDKLRDPATSRADKRIWLRFLGHFYGDMHQPLHIGRKTDLGGNKVVVKWYGEPKYDYAEIMRVDGAPADCMGEGLTRDVPTGECVTRKSEVRDISLHKVWDLHVPETYIKKNRLQPERGDSEYLHKAFASSIDQKVDRAEWETLAYSLPSDWLAESLAVKATGIYLDPSANGRDLGDDYYEPAMKIVKERVVRAGIRLAATLDRIFDPSSDRTHRAAFMALREAELRAHIEAILAAPARPN